MIDIHQLNLIMEVLGTPSDEFIMKITSESVSSILRKEFLFLKAIILFLFRHELLYIMIKRTKNFYLFFFRKLST